MEETMKFSVLSTGIVVGASIIATAVQADKWSDQFPHIKNTGDIPGECSYESMSKKDYSGRKLTINTHAVPVMGCLLYTSPSPRDRSLSRMPSSA